MFFQDFQAIMGTLAVDITMRNDALSANVEVLLGQPIAGKNNLSFDMASRCNSDLALPLHFFEPMQAPKVLATPDGDPPLPPR